MDEKVYPDLTKADQDIKKIDNRLLRQRKEITKLKELAQGIRNPITEEQNRIIHVQRQIEQLEKKKQMLDRNEEMSLVKEQKSG